MPFLGRMIGKNKQCFAALFAVLALMAGAVSTEKALLRAGEAALLTPEEVAGVSMGEIDAISETSPGYALSPDGKDLPIDTSDDCALRDPCQNGFRRRSAPSPGRGRRRLFERSAEHASRRVSRRSPGRRRAGGR